MHFPSEPINEPEEAEYNGDEEIEKKEIEESVRLAQNPGYVDDF